MSHPMLDVVLEKAPDKYKSILTAEQRNKIQQSTTLSVTEAELCSGVDCVQDMLFAMRFIESIGLKMITQTTSDENKNKYNIHVFNLYFSKQLLPTFERDNPSSVQVTRF
jgi:hypothetical protein